MINWWEVLTSSLWVGGLAGLLATFSYCDYIASRQGEPRRKVLGSSFASFYFSVSAIVFCLGAGLCSGSWLVRGVWCLLLVLFAWQAWQSRHTVGL